MSRFAVHGLLSRLATNCRVSRRNISTKFLTWVFFPRLIFPKFFSPVSSPRKLQTSQNIKGIIEVRVHTGKEPCRKEQIVLWSSLSQRRQHIVATLFVKRAGFPSEFCLKVILCYHIQLYPLVYWTVKRCRGYSQCSVSPLVIIQIVWSTS